jgi:hypothetical protein
MLNDRIIDNETEIAKNEYNIECDDFDKNMANKRFEDIEN